MRKILLSEFIRLEILNRPISTHSNKVILSTLLFLFSFQCIVAQSIISGKIVDSNNEPIPFAHIRLENTNIGTISNDIGVFKLVVHIENKNKLLIISSLGYKTEKITLNDEYQTITLTEDVTQLNEVVIVSKDYAKELIEKAINEIPNNYPIADERHTGFFRETTTWENEKKPIYINEAVIDAIKEDYTGRNRSGDVKLVELRKYESEELDSLNFRIYAGSHHIHRFDIVARREAFLSNPKAYKYKIIDTLRQNEKDIYKILVEKKNENSAYVYIQEETFAIVKADIKLNSDFGNLGNREFFNFTVTYEQGEDKRWRFMNSYYKTAFKKQGKILNLTSEYVTTDIKPSNTKIPYLERLQFSEILLDETKEYNPDFWNNYTIISPNEISESLFKSIDYTKVEKEKKQSDNIPDFVKRMSFEIGLTWTALDIADNSINYNNSIINIQQNNNAINKGSVSFSISIFYAVTPNLLIGYANESKISRTGINSNDFVIAGKFNLNPNGRPINISPRLHFGYQELDYYLKQFDLEEDIEIDGKEINSEKVSLFLSQRGFRVKPGLVLSIESSKNVSFLISTSYNLHLNQKNGLVFREKGEAGLFPRKIFLENGQENLSIETNQESLFENTISINAGIAFRF
ncbi:carboxypeptidase-like regulatory domain-containing protein [Lacinutrix undariae]